MIIDVVFIANITTTVAVKITTRGIFPRPERNDVIKICMKMSSLS